MIRAWDLSSDDIDGWADQGSAPMLLPRLVRRLILASSSITSIDMAADGGVRVRGWDGVVRCETAGAFCPIGQSGWELSVEKAIRRKLRDDFDGRSLDPSPLVPAETTYVAVTARRYPTDKAKWEAEQRQQGGWKNVRMIDAEGLATWLEQCPSVASWFRAQLGHPVDDIRDLESYLEHWGRQTNPRFTAAIATAGRVRQAEDVQQWLLQPKPDHDILTIHTEDTFDEPLVFAAGALQRLPELARDRLLAQSVVVLSKSAFRWAAAQSKPLLIFPAFKDFSADLHFDRGHLIAPIVGSPPPALEPKVRLAWLADPPLQQLLVEAGLPKIEAERKVAAADGKLSALRQLCGHIERPAWASWTEEEALYAMLLAGKWHPGHAGDRDAIRSLGADPDRVEQLCVQLQDQPSPPVRRELNEHRQPTLQLTSPRTVWAELASGLTESRLQRFSEVIRAVLAEADPRCRAPEQPHAGKTPKYSPTLRAGLARSLVMLSLHEERLPAGLHGRRWVRGLLRQLLPSSWQQWASLAPLLPTLAEADPSGFLDLLEDSLHAGNDGIGRLMQTKTLANYSPKMDLTAALELLGWSPELMPRVAYALAGLAAFEDGGTRERWSLVSMRAMVREELPQTLATVAERLAVLRKLFKKDPQFAWSLVRELLPRAQILHVSARPEWQSWPLPAADDRSHPVAEVLELRKGVLALLMKHAQDDGVRWAELIDSLLRVPDAMVAPVFDELEARHGRIQDDDAQIPSALRKRLWMLKGSQPTARTSLHNAIERTEQVYRRFVPARWVHRYGWVFRRTERMPQRFDDYREEDKRREEMQESAMQAIWEQPDPWQTLAELVAWLGDESEKLARPLTRSTGAAQFEKRLLDGPSFGPYAPIAPLFLVLRHASQAAASKYTVIGTLLSQGRQQEAVLVAQRFAPEPVLWDLLDTAGEPARSAYWRGAPAPGGDDPEQRGRGIRNLLAAGALNQALAAAAWGVVPAPEDVLLQVLESARAAMIRAQTDETASPLQLRECHYQIGQVFELLENGTGLDPNALLRLEIFFLPLLRHSSHQPKLLWRTLAAQPEFFVQVLGLLYRTEEGSKKGPSQDPHEIARAEAAAEILDGWEGIPGGGLAADAREENLYQWTRAVIDAATKCKISAAAVIEVARVLSRAPDGADGIWPCMAARRLLEEHVAGLLSSLHDEGWNRRGVFTKAVGEGGDQERSLAASYRAAAKQVRIEFPETDRLLSGLADSYEKDAQSEELVARGTRRRYGMPAE